MLKKIIIKTITVILIICLYSNICYGASVTVTEENLKEAFEKMLIYYQQDAESSEENLKNVSVSNGEITMELTTGETYKINYDLTDKPTFKVESSVYEGMSEEEFDAIGESAMNPIFGYIAVANIQGIEFEDSLVYIYFSILSSIWGQSQLITENANNTIGESLISEKIDIYSTLKENIGEDVTFEDGVINYVNEMFKQPITFSDADGINSYTFTYKKTDMTETTGKIVSELTVNTDADFSELEDYATKLEESFMDQSITEENADYLIKLKVGQKCQIKTNSSTFGYSSSGSSCINIDRENKMITAIDTGKANGYFYLDNNVRKSFYVIVEENTENEILDTIYIEANIDNNTPSPNNQNNSNSQDENNEDIDRLSNSDNNNSNTNKDNDKTTATIKLPKTGLNYIIYILFVAIISIIFVLWKKMKKE